MEDWEKFALDEKPEKPKKITRDVLVNFRATSAERELLKKLAMRFARDPKTKKGNLSKFLMKAAKAYRGEPKSKKKSR